MGERNKRVFELMRERNLRKVDIAECLGISKSAVTQWEKKGTAPVVPAEVSEMLSDKSFADIYNPLSDKEKHALWHSVIDHIEFDMDGNITEIFYIH